MELRRLGLACCCFALFVLAAVPEPVYSVPDPEIDPERFCSYACTPGADPCRTCRSSFTEMTCGQFWGRPANDLDADGIVNTSDNCRCVANANQANCDGDGYGDACDPQDNSWALISAGTQRCHLDEDNHTYKVTLELYYQNIYRSSCTGQTCYKKYLLESFDCSITVDTYQCCLDNWWDPDCGGAWNQDQCGYPRCNF